ncbi:hypothetical protein Acr_00g0042360 [Actinidia rufa]|uniref:Uncharacterized protein n=1 Tax=Actinidia rufa TaxID=165716 RepID=A0A7J0DID9_9ERIC|nr:hypothetical protein Acr_00g0042360 [Actinidia rufa]
MASFVPESSEIIESSLALVAHTVALTSHPDPRTATITDTSPGPVPNLSHIQFQLGLLQSQLGSLLQQQLSGSTTTLVTGAPTAFYAKTSHPTWILDFEVNDHMIDKLSISLSPVVPIHQIVYLANVSTSIIQHKVAAMSSLDNSLWAGEEDKATLFSSLLDVFSSMVVMLVWRTIIVSRGDDLRNLLLIMPNQDTPIFQK